MTKDTLLYAVKAAVISLIVGIVFVCVCLGILSGIPSHKSPPTNDVSTTAVATVKPITFQIPKGEALMQYYNHEVLTARIEGKKHVLKVYSLNSSNPKQPQYIITYP